MIHSLDRFPDQRKLFETEPDVIPNAVQEFIRFQTPLKHMRRTATQDHELFGSQIEGGRQGHPYGTIRPIATRPCSTTPRNST